MSERIDPKATTGDPVYPPPSDIKTEDELIAAAHPRPWNWIWIGTNSGAGGGHIYLTDANGRKIAAIWGKAEEKEAAADLIVGLVNNAG